MRAPEVDRFDVVVAGAGPAGGMAALGLARAGARVLLVDAARLPRWKVCGACVGPAAQAVLRRAGVAEEVLRDAPRLQRMVLRSPGRQARLVLGEHLCLSRARLDQRLSRAAARHGAELRFGVRVTAVETRPDDLLLQTRCEGSPGVILARILVDATGLGAGIPGTGARLRGRTEVQAGSRIGVGASFVGAAVPLAEGELLMVLGKRGYVGLVRTEDDAVNVAAALDPNAVALDGVEGAVADILWPGGVELPADPLLPGWRGTPALTRRPPSVALPRTFRIGDSAGYVEPFTGEGIGWALASGEAVVPFALEALRGREAEAARGWARQHRRAVGGRQWLCRAIARGLRYPWLVDAAVGTLQRLPGLADPLVATLGRPPAPLPGGRSLPDGKVAA